MISNKITIGNIWFDFMDEPFQHAVKLVKGIVRPPPRYFATAIDHLGHLRGSSRR